MTDNQRALYEEYLKAQAKHEQAEQEAAQAKLAQEALWCVQMEVERAAEPECYTPSEDICGAEQRMGISGEGCVCVLPPHHPVLFHRLASGRTFYECAAPKGMSVGAVAMTENRYLALYREVSGTIRNHGTGPDPRLRLLNEMREAAKKRMY